MPTTVSKPIARRGLMLVLSSPSGAGKSTIAKRLVESDPAITLSISVTTRAQRPSEVGDRDYHFIGKAAFEKLRDGGDLLEWAEVHGNFYGTPRAPVEMALGEGRDMLFDIDWQGTQQLARAMPADLVRVFVLPPSMEELRARLIRRAEDNGDVIAKRLANARAEIEHWREYEYVVINERVEDSLAIVQAVLKAEREKRQRRPGLQEFVDRLVAKPVAGTVG